MSTTALDKNSALSTPFLASVQDSLERTILAASMF